MKIAISAETTIDMPKTLLNSYDIKTVPFSILLGDEIKNDGDITIDEIIEFVNKNKSLPKTSAVNEYQYEEHFSNLLKEYDAVVHFSLSSTLSSAYLNACKVAEKMNNVYVLDTKTLSTGIALLAIYATKLAKENISAKEIYEKCKVRIPYVQASFELSRLDYLYKGGRCSMLSLLGANILKIKPQIIVQDGKMVAGKKYRGSMEYVVKNYVTDILQTYDNPDLDEVFLTYTTADKSLLDYVTKVLRDRGFKNIHLTRAGGTITCHCGENCLGVLYINDGGAL